MRALLVEHAFRMVLDRQMVDFATIDARKTGSFLTPLWYSAGIGVATGRVGIMEGDLTRTQANATTNENVAVSDLHNCSMPCRIGSAVCPSDADLAEGLRRNNDLGNYGILDDTRRIA